jgi:hypothetical protein
MQKYSINQPQIDSLLAWIKNGDIAIPEIQRPFVWSGAKVRDLIDSLYSGYPIGYLITWRNPDVRLKDGTSSGGKKILIDGQQRVTALMAALLGEYIINDDYKRVRIRIAFHPAEQKFEVCNPAIEKDKDWIPDISKLFSKEMNLLTFVDGYCKRNVEADRNSVYEALERLNKITTKQIGVIELNPDLDIEVVTEIFIRINSQGVKLSQADFAMSKIASNERYDGPNIRKCIDYFAHLAIAPEFYNILTDNDQEFIKTEYFPKMQWLKNEKDDLYDPSYKDIIRTAFTYKFERGRLKDLVSLLSGRNFETREYEEEIEESSFKTLKEGLSNFMNESNFKRFIMILKSAGFVDTSLIRSKNVTNYAYALYLKLREEGYKDDYIESAVRRWFVLSILTKRYSGSPESAFDFDIKRSSGGKFPNYLRQVEEADLSDAYWTAGLVQSLDTSVASSPFFHVYLAAQVKSNDKGFLSRDITVKDLIEHKGDIHHIFPRSYLKKHGLTRGRYNQIANYVYMQSEINIRVGSNPPKKYFTDLRKQVNGNQTIYGGITDEKELMKNLKMNCIPEDIFEMTIDEYDDFLQKRRELMAKKIRKYYESL